MKYLILLVVCLFYQLQTIYAEPTLKLYVDGEELNGQSFDKNSIINVKIINEDDDIEYRIDKISIEVKLEEGGTKIVNYKKQKIYAHEQNENGGEIKNKVYIYPTRFEKSPQKRIDLSDFKELEDLCVSRIIIQIHKVSYLENGRYNSKKVSSRIIDYSKTYSIWANWSCYKN